MSHEKKGSRIIHRRAVLLIKSRYKRRNGTKTEKGKITPEIKGYKSMQIIWN
jgi:hypothetical protein